MDGSFRSGGIRRRFCSGLQQRAGVRNANAAAGYRASDGHAGPYGPTHGDANANAGTCTHRDADSGTDRHARPYRYARPGAYRHTRAHSNANPGYSFQQPGQLPKRWILRSVEPRRPHHRSGLAGC